MRLSHSAIETYHNCPRRYYWERVLKIQTEDGIPLVVGSLYHAVLEKILKAPVRCSETEDEAIEEAIRDAAEHLVRLDIDIDDLDEEIRENLRKIDFTYIHPVVVHNQPLVERWFTNEGLNYVGKIDLVNQHLPIVDDKGNIEGWTEDEPCVLDFKTVGSRRKSQRDANLSAQLAGYCLETGVRTAGFYEIPRNLEKPHRVRVKTFTEEELRQWSKWRASQCAAITAIHPLGPEFFPMCPRTNPLCSMMWCPHWDRCYGEPKDT